MSERYSEDRFRRSRGIGVGNGLIDKRDMHETRTLVVGVLEDVDEPEGR